MPQRHRVTKPRPFHAAAIGDGHAVVLECGQAVMDLSVDIFDGDRVAVCEMRRLAKWINRTADWCSSQNRKKRRKP